MYTRPKTKKTTLYVVRVGHGFFSLMLDIKRYVRQKDKKTKYFISPVFR